MWHVQDVKEICRKLEVDPEEGLSSAEADARLKKYGPNQLQQKQGVSLAVLFVNQFKNLIVLLLAAAIVISIFLGQFIEALAILAVIIINALMGFITEYKAERAMDALKKMASTTAKVVREGRLAEIPAEEVVPGDILVLEEGDRITADGRLVEADNLAVIEASLTGESRPSEKKQEKLAEKDAPLGDRANMVFMGTNVARGSGRAVVVATGAETEIGNIANLLEETQDEQTPLEKRLDHLGRNLAKVSMVIAVVIALAGILFGKPLFEMLITSIALAIAAVPEGLPAVATITLATGMSRMARQNAIIRRLPAVETLGSTTVICTNKTGTVTENQMKLEEICLGSGRVRVTGKGYEPKGDFIFEDTPKKSDRVLPAGTGLDGDLLLFLQAAALASKAGLHLEKGKRWDVIGDPTEGALIAAARKAGFDREEAGEKGYELLKEIPFSSEEKRMAVYYRLPDGSAAVFVKGAPLVVLETCSYFREGGREEKLDEEKRNTFTLANAELAGRGQRVLGVAYKMVSSTEEDAFKNLVFLGLAGMEDPPREEVGDAIREARKAGVRTVMITGDQPATAAAIASKIGLLPGRDTVFAPGAFNMDGGMQMPGAGSWGTVAGVALARMNTRELAAEVKKTAVFARISPEDKLKIVEALKNNGEVVAMTGDGVNDAPALKRADIGVSMGVAGTAVAREASDMILTDDNFATIVRAVKQGRVILDNIQKFIHYLFSCNLSEILIIFLAVLANLPVPLIALQILWLNLVTDVFPALALGWEPPEKNVMERPPRNPKEGIISKDFYMKILAQGAALALGPLAVYIYSLHVFNSLVVARTTAFLTTALAQLFHVLNVRRTGKFGVDRTLLENPVLWGAFAITLALQAVAVYLPLFNLVLKTVPLSGIHLLLVLAGASVPIFIIQVLNRSIFKIPFTARFELQAMPGPVKKLPVREKLDRKGRQNLNGTNKRKDRK